MLIIPVILEGETFFSWVSRIFAASGKKQYLFLREFIGEDILCNHQIKPLKEEIVHINILEMIDRNTPLGIMKSFILREDYNRIQQDIIQRKRWGIIHNKELTICPVCYKNDLEKYGEAYLRVEHQIEGNKICNEHKVDLIRLERYRYDGVQTLFVSDLTIEELQETYNYKEDIFIELSKMIHMIYTGALAEIDLKLVQEKYKKRIIELGYYKKRREIARLSHDINSYYGEVFLKDIDPTIVLNGKENWINFALIHPVRSRVVIHHLLIIKYLFGGLEEFIAYDKDKVVDNPFGEGPWKCLNYVCTYYQQAVIEEYSIEQSARNRKILKGIWKCPYCGYTYMKTTNYEEDKHRVIEYGHVWKNKLSKLSNNSVHSKTYIARCMGCSTNTINKMQIELGLVKISDEEINSIKAEILELVRQKPNITRKDIHGIFRERYTIVKKYEQQWLKENLPKQRFGYEDEIERSKVWEERDRELSKAVERIAKRIIENKEKIQISRRMLASELDFYVLENTRMHKKIPLTKGILDKYCEDISTFNKRIASYDTTKKCN